MKKYKSYFNCSYLHLILVIFLFLPLSVLALEIPSISSLESFLDSIQVDLPPSDVTCRASGSLNAIFNKTHTFKSGGNTFFVDKENKEMANFQRAVIDDNDRKLLIQMFIKIPNVQRETLVDLLINKKIIATKDAQVVFIMKEATPSKQSVYINESIDQSGNPVSSIIYTKLSKVGNLNYRGKKFVTADGVIKIRFPEPPKLVRSDGRLVQTFDNSPGLLICSCKNCPFHDFDLTDLKDAFDGDLVNNVINEASE